MVDDILQGSSIMKRSELEVTCEDFSNVIGSSSIGTLHKGALSGGAEIVVLSYAVKNMEWSNNMQTLFWKKVDKLGRVNHKNFLNLLDYCEEEKPYTRMLVFEYAPSCTLFEHLYDYTTTLLGFSIWSKLASAAQPTKNFIKITTNTSEQLKLEDNVYSFGLILLKMVTGNSPRSMNTGTLNE